MSTTTFTQKATVINLPSAGKLWRWLANLSLCLATLAFASTAFAQNPTPTPITTARVMTDKSDYAPGTTATIFGSGFQPGETVTLQVLHADGTPATGADHDPWTVTADILGGVNTTWHVCEDDCLGSLLKLTAVGQSSALWAATWFTDAEVPPNLSACGTTLMNRTTNDGSFESNAVYNVNFSPTSLPPVWTITSTGPGIGGLLSNPPHSTVLAGADGSDGLFADGNNPNTTTAISYNLLGGTYTTVSAGDIFSWSFMVNAYGPNGSATLKLNFGAGDITVGTGTSGDGNILAFRTYSGTYTATAADAAGGQLRVKFSITNATGDNVYGDNIILKVLPVGLPDGDGDGVPDNCDICPDIANPAQDNKVACIAVEAASATCLESQINLNNANQSGNVTVSENGNTTPSSIRFEILATCGADPLSFYLNGILLGSTTANQANQCTCSPSLQTFTVSNAGLIASAWQVAGNNTWRVVKPGTSSYLAWVQAVLQVGATSETVCVYNYSTKNCGDMNLCNPHSPVSVDNTRTITSPFVGPIPVLVTPYTNGQLPQEINISTLDNGQYLLCVSAPAKPESIRFEILNTLCSRAGTYQFFLNGNSIGSTAADPTNSCTCGPALQTFLVTNPTLLANWNSGGNNTLSFTLNGNTLLSWVRAIVTKGTESSRAVLYDYNGGNADVIDLCSAGYIFDQGTITGSASVSLVSLSEDCVPFTKAGEEKIVINGLCNQAPVAICQNVTVSAGANCSANASINNGSNDPDAGNTITLTQSPAGPYQLGNTTVTLTVTDNHNASSTCTAVVTVNDNQAPTLTNPGSQTLNVNANNCTATYTITDPISDNCTGSHWGYSTTGVTSLTSSGNTIADGTNSASLSFNKGVTTVTLTGTDGTNAATTVSFTVTVSSTLSATCSNTNPSMYYGYPGDQSSTIKANATGGVGPYTISITMNRPLNCNVITSSGDELWAGVGGTNSNNVCPTSGPGLIPVSTGTGIASGVDYSVNVTLLQDATFTATITDANGCVTTCTTSVHGEDARCFAGNSGNAKVKICHQTNSANNPCVEICVDQSAVATHLAHGDFLGNCTPNCVAPVYGRGVVIDAEPQPIDVFNVKVIPNPTDYYFTLDVEGGSNERIVVIVYDVLGRIVKHIEMRENQLIKFGEDFKVGTYMAEVRQGKNRKILKLLKVK